MSDVEDIGGELVSILDPPRVLGVGRRLLGSEPIAIVSAACRYPRGIDDLDAFWRFMEAGRDAVDEVPRHRWDLQQFWDERSREPGKTYSRWAALFDDLTGFEPAFFGISSKDADRLDPQQRLMLELGWEAFERGGWSRKRLCGALAGVFIGAFTQDWFDLQHAGRPYCAPEAALGSQLGLLAARLSYWLDLRGPAMVIETACSSSLVALHLAAQSLRLGECDVALAGGVQLFLTPRQQIMCSQLQMLSPRGRCHVFDDSADGLALGEGAGVVVLERLSDAIASGAPILGLIRGSAVNQDGRTLGISAPNPFAQQRVLDRAVHAAGIDPRDIGYIEAHGTGTAIGDPCELESIHNVYGSGKHRCFIGSSKANLGHTVAAAGMAGLFRALGVLHRERVPRQLHYRTPNHRFSLAETRFSIARSSETHRTSLAAVSSFGNSGTNAHVVVEKPPARVHTSTQERPWIYVVSEPDAASQAEALHRHALLLSATPTPIGELASTSCVRRTRHRLRTVTVASSPAEAATRLSEAGVGRRWVENTSSPTLVFLFPGHGAQRDGMGRGLLRESAAVEPIARIDAIVARELGVQLRAALEHGRPVQPLDEQLLIFAYQVGLATLWRSWGLVPELVLGHSMGEIAAAVACGGLSLEDATSVMIERRRALSDVSTPGGLVLAELARAEALALCEEFEGRIEIAAHNGPRSVVLAAPSIELDALLHRLERERRFARRVRIPFAAHSRWVGTAARALSSRLMHLSPRTTSETRFVSTVHTPARVFSGEYWAANLRHTVEFDEALQTIVAAGSDLLVVEVAPLGVLGRTVREHAERTHRSIHVESIRPGDEATGIVDVAGRVHERGIELDWSALGYDALPCAELPTHPWQRQRHWSVPRTSTAATRPHLSPPLLSLLRDHRVGGDAVVPASCVIDLIVREGGANLRDIRFASLCSVPTTPHDGLTLTFEERGASTLVRHGDTPLLEYTVDCEAQEPTNRTLALPERGAEDFQTVDLLAFYEAWRTQHGVDYGPAFQAIESLAVGRDDAWAWIDAAQASNTAAETLASEPYVLHPIVLDACLHAAASLVPDFFTGDGLLPVGIASLVVFGRLPSRVLAHAITRDDASFDIEIADPSGAVQVLVRGLRVQGHSVRRGPSMWVPAWQELEAGATSTQTCYIVGPDAEVVRSACAAFGIRATEDPDDAATTVVAAFSPVPGDGATATLVQAFETVRAVLEQKHARRIVLMTCRSDDARGAALGAYGGLANALAAEFPDHRWVHVELEATSDLETILRFGFDGPEDRLRIRDGRVHGLRWRIRDSARSQPPHFSEFETIIVSGGTGGVGLHLVRALLDAGVQHVVSVARRGSQVAPDSPRWKHVAVDVCDRSAVATAITQLRDAGHRIDGVIHAAGVNVEAPFHQHDSSMIRAAVAAKFDGAAHLAEACGADPLRFFCAITSLSGTLGAEGQAAYAAGNAAVEALVLHLRASGMPAFACSFGPWQSTGMMHGRDALSRRFEASGVKPMPPADATAAVLELLESSDPLVVVADWDVERWAMQVPERQRPCWSSLLSGGSSPPSRVPADGHDFRHLCAEEQRTTAQSVIRSALIEVLGLRSATELDEHTALTDLGMTSLTALDLRDRIERVFGVRIPSTTLWRQPNLHGLVELVLERCPTQTPPQPTSCSLGNLKSEELEAILARELAELDL